MRTRIVLVVLALAALALLVFLLTRRAGDFDKAMEAVGEAIARGDLVEAMDKVRAARPLARTPQQRFGLHMVEGTIYERQDRDAEAQEAYRAALAVEGVKPDTRLGAYVVLAMSLEDADKPAEVRATWTQAVDEDFSPKVRCLALANLASAWRKEGKLDDAKSTYAELLQLAEERADSQWVTHAHTGIGDVLAEESRFAGALEAYEKALCAGGGSEAFISLHVGQALIGLKRYADARRVLSVLVDGEPVPFFTRDQALMLTADALEAEGKSSEAEQVREQLYERSAAADTLPEFDPQALFALRVRCRVASFMAIGKFYLDHGAKDQARETFTRIVEMEGARAEDKQEAQAYLDEMD